MIRIAICDNDCNDLDRLNTILNKYSYNNKELEINITQFTDPHELVESIDKEKYDIFFLDIIMPETNGIHLGKLIRQRNIRVPIVYTTSSREFAFDAWEVRAFHYLEKPVLFQEVSSVMSEILKFIDKHKPKSLSVNTKNGIVTINPDDVMFIENVARCCVYNMIDGQTIEGLCNRTSFEEGTKPVTEYCSFLQPHKSFMVNMKYINALSNGEFQLDNGKLIPISRKRYIDIKREYMKYLSIGGTN